jgi:uncharacterized protein (TIGR00369 family)
MADTSIFDRFPTPPIAILLGWRLLHVDRDAGRVRIAFDGKPEFRNPAGFIQGGVLASMLDDTMGPAVLVASDGAYFTTTIDMTVSFLAPAKVGPIIGEGAVVQLGKTIAFVEGRLLDADGKVLAKATASARLIPTEKLKP